MGHKEKALQERTDSAYRNSVFEMYMALSPNIPRGFTSAFRISGNGIFTTRGANLRAFRSYAESDKGSAPLMAPPFEKGGRKLLKMGLCFLGALVHLYKYHRSEIIL